jgi:superfamily II DNA or RNA helicase
MTYFNNPQEPLRLKTWKYQSVQNPAGGPHRRGHIEGVLTACRRFSEGKRYTSIVLPTRYGKSDLARFLTFAGVYGLETESGIIPPFASCVLFLSHQRFLGNQILDSSRWVTFVGRIGFSNLTQLQPAMTSINEVPSSVRDIPANCIFLSSTVHKIAANTDVFQQWIRSLPKPPIVIADEAQFYSEAEDKAWGPALKAAGDAGAFVLPMTGTPIRADKEPIPGFEQSLSDADETTFTKVEVVDENPQDPESDPDQKWLKVERYAREYKHFELTPHFAVTRREAWQLKYLCRVQRALVEIITDKGPLHTLSIAEQQNTLSKALRNPDVINKFIDEAEKKIGEYRKYISNAGCIVFTQNNANDDNHAERVSRLLERRGYQVIRATMDSSGDALAQCISRFAEHGQGDFLVVKQAAGAGLDCPRIKVCMDLSNVRTDAACEQRWNRCATPAQADIGGGMVTVATLIAPDETKGNNIFRRIYEDQEGAAEENIDALLDTTYIPYEPKTDPTFVEGAGTTRYDDVNGLEAEGTDIERAERFLHFVGSTIPSSGLASTTIPEAALLVTKLGITDAHLGVDEAPIEGLAFAPYDPSKEISRIRQQNVELAREITKFQLRINGGGEPDWGFPFAQAYKRINTRKGTRLFDGDYYQKSVDVDVFRTVNTEMRRILKEMGAKTDV